MIYKLALLAAGAVLATEPAQAQSADDTGATSEIVVTAQRREQSVLEVPLSIQALSGEQLAASGIRTLTSLQLSTPGYLPNTNSGFTQIFIRGVGNSLFVGADPSVATFVDDVPRIYGSMADNLVDVERIEVLKGAQGGLYGRNSTGGVVNVVTRNPSLQDVSGELRASYGEKNSLQAVGYLNVPLSSSIAVSLSAERDSHDGYVKNIARSPLYTAAMFPSGSTFGSPQATAAFFNKGVQPTALNDQDFWAVRGKLLFKPSDTFSFVLAGDYYDKDDANGQGQINVTPDYTRNFVAGLFSSFGIATALPANLFQSPGKFQAAQGTRAQVGIEEYGVSGTAKLDLGDIELTSITAYRHQKSDYFSDSSVADAPSIITSVVYPSKHYFYQEVRAVSRFSGPLQVLGGATFLESKLNGETDLFILTPDLPLSRTAVRQKVTNWSVYLQAEYDLTDKLRLTGSGRFIHEVNKTMFTQPVVSQGQLTSQKFVPSATLSYKLDGGTAYLRWARGFKPGGVNLVAAPVFFPRPQDGSAFGGENVDTFEAGYRQPLFDRRVQFTAAVFYNKYRGIQVGARGNPAFPQISVAVVNAKSARSWGVEAGATWRVADPLSISVNAGYLNAKYQDFRQSGSAVIADFDLSGRQMTNAPEFQFSANAALDTPLNDRLRLVGNVLASHTSEVLFQPSALPGVLPDAVGPAYWLVNARIGVKTADGRFEVAAVANNLFNQGYFTAGNTLAVGNDLAWGDPRIIRGEVTIRF
jgi:iron complex outermembrane receptor protein